MFLVLRLSLYIVIGPVLVLKYPTKYMYTPSLVIGSYAQPKPDDGGSMEVVKLGVIAKLDHVPVDPPAISSTSTGLPPVPAQRSENISDGDATFLSSTIPNA